MKSEDVRKLFRNVIPPKSKNRLPIVRIAGRLYFMDSRLQEFRRVNDPFERIGFDEHPSFEPTDA